jgi:nitrite reductase/ring-hydroxylating ferredoxin subunit/uncharacterized membrane protein
MTKAGTKVAVALSRAVDRIERFDKLDGVAEYLVSRLGALVPSGPVEDLLSGTPLGHPAHPMLVAVPIGAWSTASVLDLTGGDARTTRAVVATGTLAALPTAATGLADWLTTSGPERRVGLVHAAVNSGALALQVASWSARRRSRLRGAALSAVALGLTAASGWLGGHLAYALGVGVDTTAFQHLPTEWTDVCGEDEVADTPAGHVVAGVPIVVLRAGSDLVAMADRCTHRGGPLHDGTLENGCITCPWHASTFDTRGAVVSGPATRPQPTLDVRILAGRVQVRRDEQRTLRTNPVGR